MQISQLNRDRQRWRKVDHQVARYSLVSALVQLMVFCVLLPDALWLTLPKTCVLLGLVLTIFIVARFIAYFGFDALYNPGPMRWQSIYIRLHHTHTFVWSWVNALVIHHFALESVTMVSMLFTLALTFTNISIWAPYARVNQIHVSLMMLPAIIAFAAHQSLYAGTLSVMLVICLWGMWNQASVHHRRFWAYVQSVYEAQESRRGMLYAEQKSNADYGLHTDFLSNLSREIRVPMNNLLGMLTLLSDTHLNTEQRRMQNIAMSAGENLITLIEEILDFSKIMSGRLQLENNVFNIRRCIDESINVISPLAYSKQIELVVLYATDIPLRVQGDSKRISQGLSNLISYLIDHAAPSELVVTVDLDQASSQEGELKVCLSTNALSISESEVATLKALFAADYDFNSISNVNLGLSIAKGVAESMNGKMDLQVLDDSTILFEFYARIVLSTQQTFRSSLPKAFVKKRVLLVNSGSGLTASLRSEMESWMMEVQDIHDTQKALQVLRNSEREGYPFHLVVVNVSDVYQGIFKFSTILASDPSLGEIKQLFLCALHQRGETHVLDHEKKFKQCVFLTKPHTRGNLFYALSVLFDGQVSKDLYADERDQQTAEAKLLKPYRILLVEDDKVSQMVAKGILKRLGYQLNIVDNAHQALTACAHKAFDLILMDCRLQGMDGFELTKAIRKSETSYETRTNIVAITASTSEGIEAQCYAAGMDAYLTKPIDTEKLEATLRVFLESAPHKEGVIRTGSREL